MHGCLKMQHGKFTKMRRKITPGTRKSRKIKLHAYQKMRGYMSSALSNAIVKRESITLFPWTCASISSISSSNVSIFDPRFSILNSRSPTPDSRISIFDSRISIFDLRSVILIFDLWSVILDLRSSIRDSRSLIPESFGIENRVSSRDCHQRTYERTTVYQREINYI